MKLTKESVKFMLDHPECGPFIVEHYKEGAYGYKQVQIVAKSIGELIACGREQLILVDPVAVKAKKVWRINIWRKK